MPLTLTVAILSTAFTLMAHRDASGVATGGQVAATMLAITASKGIVPCVAAARAYFVPVETRTSAAASMLPHAVMMSVQPTVSPPPAMHTMPAIAAIARNRL